MLLAGIPIGMRNPVRTTTGGVAFAQGPATSFNPCGIETDEVGDAYIIRSARLDKAILDVGRSGSQRDDFIHIGRARLIGCPLATIPKQIHHKGIGAICGIIETTEDFGEQFSIGIVSPRIRSE